MEAPRKPLSDAHREKAEKFYEQSLLLVDCCRIPEAIRLLEQAIKLNPGCELYKETLAFFQISSQYHPDYLHTGEQGSSYANVARPKPNLNHGKENYPSINTNAKSSGIKENPRTAAWSPSVSATCYSDSCEQSTINNPWASFVNRNSKRKKSQTFSSPIDGLSEIEIPPVNDMYYTQNLSSKESCAYCDKPNEAFTTPVTCTGSQQTIHEDEIPVKYAQENSIDSLADGDCCKKPDFLEEHNANSANHGESLDGRFLEELCNARESETDDWAEYYDVLCNGLKEDVSCEQSDDLLHNAQATKHEFCDTLDDISDTEDLKYRNHLMNGRSRSAKSDATCSNNVCSKCGLLQADRNDPPSPTKTRIHFVKGVCVSSSTSPICTCSKQSKNCSEKRSTNSSLSPSQQEFYRNLRHYFESENGKHQKTPAEVENESWSTKNSDSHQKSASCSTNISSDTVGNKSNHQNVTESMHSSKSTRNETKVHRESSMGYFGSKAKDDEICEESRQRKPLFNADEIKRDQKSSDDERFRPTGKQPRASTHDKVRSRNKLPTKHEHGFKYSKEGVSQNGHSQRSKPRVKDKSRGHPNMKTEDNSRPEHASETRSKVKHKHRAEQRSGAGIDFNAILISFYRSGSTVASKCFQAVKSIMYYIVLLLMLIFGFVLCCAWYTGCWLIRKGIHYTALDRLFSAFRGRISAIFHWIRTHREAQRKTSSQGQTYDLPQNGDAAIRHMLENKDNDPYSVLGVPSDATDDEIRKQYRKLAILIHPDKNPHTQADEAFKTLANAFDILSDPEKRRDFDRETAWKRRAEERRGNSSRPGSPEQFFADLGRKMKEMQNYLHCNQCDGKHRRYSTDRFIFTARFCGRCNTRHAAKEGDLWAESSFLGYKLHFYACMEGEIYDVTEWAACQGLGNYRLEPNPHTVHLKLKTRQSHPSGFSSRLEEEDFENLIRAFFGQFNGKDDRYNGSNKQPKQRKRKKKR